MRELTLAEVEEVNGGLGAVAGAALVVGGVAAGAVIVGFGVGLAVAYFFY